MAMIWTINTLPVVDSSEQLQFRKLINSDQIDELTASLSGDQSGLM